jgi:hypothetical protein
MVIIAMKMAGIPEINHFNPPRRFRYRVIIISARAARV